MPSPSIPSSTKDSSSEFDFSNQGTPIFLLSTSIHAIEREIHVFPNPLGRETKIPHNDREDLKQVFF